jgi:tRNA 5-methylaminomethyl-2-thiouridine biosynthesis bifunctional protein
MSYQPLTPATLAFNEDGVPFSPAFDDIYHSDSGGLEQARHVFIAGNNLPQAWQGREQFTILETGFGIGLNFLATWQAWRADPQRSDRLHFVSVEKHPFTRDVMAQLHRRWPQLEPFATELQGQWPPLAPGVQRLLLDSGRVTLTLLFGDATTQLRTLAVKADALYLDGFAPGKNPELWDKPFLKDVTRLCKPGATLATWTIAASVREALTSQRWTLEKRPGFGSKRDMLRGRLFGESPNANTQEKHALVIGAGIAGTAIAERLAARQWQVDILERHAAPAGEASGNPVGLLHPMLAKDDNLAARLSRAGYLYALRLLAKLEAENPTLRWSRCGILQLARDAAQELEQKDTSDALAFPDDLVAFVDHAAATKRTGHAVAAGGWLYPTAAIVNPPSLCEALLSRHEQQLSIHYNTSVARIERKENRWSAFNQNGALLGSAPVLILANAFDGNALLSHLQPDGELHLSRLRGQISILPAGALPFLRHAVCGNGYVTPDTLGDHCIGATFDTDDDDPSPRADGHRFNLDRLAELLPGDDLPRFDVDTLQGRVGFRTMTIDRMPVVGAVPDMSGTLRAGAQLRDVPRLPGLHALLALGSRGLCWGPLAAELLAAQICGEPLPLERDIVGAIDPARFLIRQQRRSIVSNKQDL